MLTKMFLPPLIAEVYSKGEVFVPKEPIISFYSRHIFWRGVVNMKANSKSWELPLFVKTVENLSHVPLDLYHNDLYWISSLVNGEDSLPELTFAQ